MKSNRVLIDATNKDWVIAEVLSKLKRQHYKLRLRRETACLYCLQSNEWIGPPDFTVDKYYYFEDILHPDSERMLYAISLPQNRKGFLIDTCNVYIDNISAEMMQKLKLDKIKN